MQLFIPPVHRVLRKNKRSVNGTVPWEALERVLSKNGLYVSSEVRNYLLSNFSAAGADGDRLIRVGSFQLIDLYSFGFEFILMDFVVNRRCNSKSADCWTALRSPTSRFLRDHTQSRSLKRESSRHSAAATSTSPPTQ